jgi:hypothetical protein
MGSNGTLIREQLHLRGWALLADWKLKRCRHYDQFPPVIQPASSASRFQQVEDNLAALRILETEAKQQHESTDSAAQSLDLSQTRYEGGVDTYLQVITWQTAALNNERNDRDLPSAIGIMSYTCFTRALFFASWLNSLSFQSALVYTNCASASLPAIPNVASAATLVTAVLTNDLRFILIVSFRS